VVDRRVNVTVGIPTYNRARWLRESMRSVLSQTFEDFRLLVCDNASDDETREVVTSFRDPRIDYRRSERNIGMIGNLNRVVDLAETEAIVLLPDDDLLYPEYLSRVVDVLERHPTVGVVHTAFDGIGGDSTVLERARTLLQPRGQITVESGDEYLERSMQSRWTVCWPSALFRRSAIIKAGGLRVDEEPLADVPLLMRIALDWDFALVSKPLVGFRLHADSATAGLGTFTGAGYELGDLPEILFQHRIRFLAEASLPKRQSDTYRSLARSTLRREAVKRLADRGGLGAPWKVTNRGLVQLIRKEPRTLLVPTTWRLVGSQLGGRYARRVAVRVINRGKVMTHTTETS
jgi:glycosyltransferase involved in cell wall biosynthesis